MNKNYALLMTLLLGSIHAFAQENENGLDQYIRSRTIDKNGKEIVGIIVPGKPPDHYRVPIAIPTRSMDTLPNVPAFSWSFGCSATAAAMAAGYYDRTGYPGMYTGPANAGIMPMDNSSWGTVVINGETLAQCPLSATRNGVDGRATNGHVDDYWIQTNSGGSDPWITNNWTEHPYGDCTGDYMGTNQSAKGNIDGATYFYFYSDGSPLYDYDDYGAGPMDGCHGLRDFYESRGYTVIQNYSQYIFGYLGKVQGFTFAQYMQEIDAGRPVFIQLEGHTMLGYGYDDATNTVYMHNTWDYSNYSMTWGGYYDGMLHKGVTVVQLGPGTNIPSANFSASATTMLANVSVTFTDLSVMTASWSWVFSPSTVTYLGGTTSSSKNPQVSFDNPGFYTVSLTATNANGSDVETKTNYIHVYVPGMWAGYTSTEWSTTSNWDDGIVPGGSTNITISTASANWPVFTGDFAVGTQCNSLSIPAGATMAVTGNFTINSGKSLSFTGTGQLNIGGNWTRNGNFTPGAGTVNFTGTSASTISYSGTISDITTYTRSTDTKGLTLLTNSSAGPTGDEGSSDVNIGFTFNYLGTEYTTAHISTNGYISMNGAGSSAYNDHLFLTDNPNNTQAPWWDNLVADTYGKVAFKTEGSAPYRVFTIEWDSVRAFNLTTAKARLTFQVKLFESTNIIEFHYGNVIPGYHPSEEGASIGIEDATGGPGHFIDATTGSTTTGDTTLKSLTEWPTVNYRFSPPNAIETFNNLTISGSGGVTANCDITVSSTLSLQAANASATKGSLDMGSKTLTMGASATTIGTGDVTGIVKRTSFVANTPYSFGNPLTTVTFASGGTLPTELKAKISIGAEPSWKTGAIRRVYDFAQTGASGCYATISTHYLNSELNGNDEGRLVRWTQGTPAVEWGCSAVNASDNWVQIPNVAIGSIPSAFGTLENALADATISSYTWNGSQNSSWATLENWTPNGYPSSSASVIIPDVTNDPALPASTEIKTLTINASGILNAADNAQLTLTGSNTAWSNNGGTFNPGSGTVIFKGAGAQTAGGSSSTIFNNLTLDNTNGLSLGQSETINGTLAFTNGKITLGAYDLLLGTSATISGSSIEKYIVTDGTGALRQRVPNTATNVIYPIGLAAKYLPVTVQLTTGSAADDIKARVADGLYMAYNANDAAIGTPVAGLAVSKTWFLKESSDGGSTATVTVLWNAADEAADFTRNACGVGHYTGGSWVCAANSAASGSNPYTQTVSGITSFSPFGVFNQLRSINGNFKYFNSDYTPLTDNITVKLFQDNTELASDVVSGTYEFSALFPGTYEVRATSTKSTAGAINTTDAAQANYWGVHPGATEKVRFHAGDVGTSGSPSDQTITALDASRIQQNFVNGSALDETWTFWKAGDVISSNTTSESYPTITLTAEGNATVDFYGLCTGDFNCSFNPLLKKSASATLGLIYAGNRQAGSDQEFDLPLKMVNAAGVGAVSLILNFPQEMVEVLDVTMDDAGGWLDWAVRGDELRIGWNSSVPVNLAAEDVLMTIRLKTTAAFLSGNSIKLALADDPLNELADGMYDVIGDAVLSVDVIEASTTGTPEIPSAPCALSFSAYPNPFSNYTTITYTLPFDGKAVLEISNLLGSRVTTLVSETQSSGNHKVKFNTYGLPAGIYFATLRLRSANGELTRTIKLVYNK